MSGARAASAFAPASVGNVGVGFDLLGHALAGAGDRVLARRIAAERAAPPVRVVAIRGVLADLPRDCERNTAARAIAALLASQNVDFAVEIEIEKGIALGSGMGGSAASAVAAVVAANALLPRPLPLPEIYPFALEGEFAASGGRHGDNVAASLLGGLVLASPERLLALPVPAGITCLLLHPDLVVETRVARERLKAPYPLSEFVAQSCALALFMAGLYRSDLALIRAGLRDGLVEPRRADLIPGFAAVKQALLDGGALGASISGAGPSVFGWFAGRAAAEAAAAPAIAAFAAAGLAADALVSDLAAPGARLESCSS
ncbi:MAG: homoserine kinase [Lysobacterales bacterium]